MEDVAALLRKVPLFSSISQAQSTRLATAARFCAYPEHVAIVEQGHRAEEAQDGDSLYIIVEGRARVVLDHNGVEEELARLGPGDFFGEMSLLDGKPRSATVEAEEEVVCLVLPRWELLRAMRRDPEIGIQMLTVLSERLRAAEQLID